MTQQTDTENGGEQHDSDGFMHPAAPQWVKSLAVVGIGSLLLAVGTALTLGGTAAVVSLVSPAASTPIPAWQLRVMGLFGFSGLITAVAAIAIEDQYRPDAGDVDAASEADEVDIEVSA